MRLNLGCGNKILEGYVNVDKFEYYQCNIVHDLEKFPYPFEPDSVDEILLKHVLEHIGQDPDVFNGVIKELYRISKNQALIDITVPHPRHDDFLADPTHVRPITAFGLSLYDKDKNKVWQESGVANSPLALINGVNFKIERVEYFLEDTISKRQKNGEISKAELEYMMLHHNNVVKQINIKWRVKKP